MNKDVVYIEPEEDITDIISKIEGSKSKIVALVPPKKAGVFRSIVNIKLISKTAANADKTVVLVTTDSSIIKLAAATKMPVTKDLKSAPKIPEPEDEDETDDTETVDVDEEAEEEPEEKEEEKEEEEKESEDEKEEEKEEKDSEDKSDDKEDDDSNDDKNDDKEDKKEEKKEEKKGDKKSKLANSNNPVLKWIGTHKKLSIGIGVGFVIFVIFMVWAFAIAPAVTITLKLETLTGNFSENVSFTDKLADENVKEGKFYIEEKKIEDKAEVEFDATGKKNVGEKASGNVVVYAYFKKAGSVALKAGSAFTYDNKLKFTSTEDATLSWDGKDMNKCDNKNNATSLINSGCQISGRVKVAATEPGTKFNIAAASSGWKSPEGVSGAYSDAAMAGGTDKEVTVVQQSDIEEAVKKLTTGEEAKQKKEDDLKKIKESLNEGQFLIESSFKQTTGDPVSDPEVGKEVAEGKKAKLTVTATTTVFVIDETKLKEFITEKAKLEKGYKIYEMKDPFVENFSNTEAGYVGKLKTSYVAGSTVTENDVVETAKDKGIGTAKRDISDHFDGIKSIDISTSVPWVTSVPGNPEKITVIINTDGDKKE